MGIGVWSESNQKYIYDGELTGASAEDGVTVVYNEGESTKTFEFDEAGKFIKKKDKKEDEEMLDDEDSFARSNARKDAEAEKKAKKDKKEKDQRQAEEDEYEDEVLV